VDQEIVENGDIGGGNAALTIPSRCDQRLRAVLVDKRPNDSSAEAKSRVTGNEVHELTRGSESIAAKSPQAASLCRSCGACCSYSRDWPRFTTEDDSDLDRIPRVFVDQHLGRMQCDGDRCAALVGEVGISTSCAVYSERPEVCRACEPGDEACQVARHWFAL
jgi:uncharacterized protein